MNIPYWLLKQLPIWMCENKHFFSDSLTCPICGKPRIPPDWSFYVHNILLPKLSPAEREEWLKYFTTIFQSGFESGSFTDDGWTGTTTSGSGTITVVSEQAHHGTYSAKSYKPNSTSSGYVYKDITSSPIVYSRFYLYVSSWTATTGHFDAIFAVRNVVPLTAFMLMLKESTRYLYIRYESGGSNYYVQSSTTVPLNTWVCLEVKYDKTNGEYRVYKDGSEVTDLTQTGKTISYNAGSVQFGFRYFDTAYGTAYFDCVVVADTYIGPEVPPKPKGSIVVHAKLAGVI